MNDKTYGIISSKKKKKNLWYNINILSDVPYDSLLKFCHVVT